MAAVTRDGDGCVPLAELDINPALRATCQRRLAAALEGRAMTARKLAEFSGVGAYTQFGLGQVRVTSLEPHSRSNSRAGNTHANQHRKSSPASASATANTRG